MRISDHFRGGMSENGDASAPASVDCDLHPYSIQEFPNAICRHLVDWCIRADCSGWITRHSYIGRPIARLPKIRAQYEKAPDPKELVILEGSAHAQFVFQTDQGERLMQEILRFLLAP
jgi:hypothetical protein